MGLIVTSLATPVSAHSGRTDSNGGHRVSATGEYHYHHGYSAHQHPNGVCPYSSKSTVEANTSTKSNTSTAQTPLTPATKTTQAVEKSDYELYMESLMLDEYLPQGKFYLFIGTQDKFNEYMEYANKRLLEYENGFFFNTKIKKTKEVEAFITASYKNEVEYYEEIAKAYSKKTFKEWRKQLNASK